jgi:DNA invertase Pin-like site-specific DNA recombinase
LNQRPALKQLIADVEGGTCEYSAVLVYDVSRWGRFQDADESAYYEYRCRRANIAVHYCAEPFSNDGSPMAVLMKAMKRTMAAEYSRELSVKVFAGQCRLTELGFRQGGTPGYGFRRLLLDENGKPKETLKRGENKSIITDRVVLIPGPAEEIAVVNEIFRLYADAHLSPPEIAKRLNQFGIAGENGNPWTRYIVARMVTNPKYIGANITNRQSAKLRSRRVYNPPEMWVRKDKAFPAIVDSALFERAQKEADSHHFLTDGQLLERLQQFWQKHGRLSTHLFKLSPDMPCGQVYKARFGSIAEAYKRIGYRPYRDLTWTQRDKPLTAIRQKFVRDVIAKLEGFGASLKQDVRRQFLTINEDLTMRIGITRCRAFKRIHSWRFQLATPYKPDVSIFARLTPGNERILDYYCVPGGEPRLTQITVSPITTPPAYVQRFEDLAFLEDLAKWRL